MSKLQIPKKIRTEDFDSDDQAMADKIAFVFNSFADEVYQALNKGLDNDNLNRQRNTISIQIGPTGQLLTNYQIKSTLNGRVSGITVLNAQNLDNPGTYPTSAPFVSFTTNGQIITILNVTGLQNNSNYSLSLELIV